MNHTSVCILGGTGFVGSHICSRLVDRGFKVKVLTRHRASNRHLLVLPGLELVQADVHDREALTRELEGYDVAINLIGILNQTRKQSFRHVHVELTLKLAQACRQAGVKRLLQMSALNADSGNGPSEYLRTRGEAENVLHLGSGNVRYTIFQPSVIFGPEDSFIRQFALLMKITMPVFPLACPDARFAPVYVGDVARAFVGAINDPATVGQRYQLCGPKTYTLHEIVTYIRDVLGLRRYILRLNPMLSRIQARVFGMLPGKLFTMDNYRSMTVDSVCREDGMKRLGIRPQSMEAVVPSYLLKGSVSGRGGQRNRLHHFRRVARR